MTLRRALVLGGGGSTGNAWLIGVVAGLADGGVDVTRADLIVGTSAGATAAAQLTSADAAELYAATIAAVPPPRPAQGAPAARGPVSSAANQMERTAAIYAAAADADDMRRRMGAAAIELAETQSGDGTARWRETVAARLTSREWPEGSLAITAVNATTGEPVLFDRDSGVDLVDAVAASTAGGPAYHIGETWYIDGGYRRSSENADLAIGCARVLVLSPLGGKSRAPQQWDMHLAAQVRELEASGSAVEVMVPGDALDYLFGANAMNPSLRAPAARAGFEQGRASAERVADFWA